MSLPPSLPLQILERIATALERIATHLEQHHSKPESSSSFTPSDSVCPPDALIAPEHPMTQTPFEGTTLIENFLQQRGITIKVIPARDDGDAILDQLATLIGTRYASVAPLLDIIKRNVNADRPFTLALREYSQVDTANICQLASRLHQIAFLTQFRYEKSPKYLLHAQPIRLPKAINFFNGGWLERFLRRQLTASLQRFYPDKRIATLSNAQVTLPNGDDFELDLLVVLEGGELFWAEAKTGNYQQYVAKYAKISKLLKLDRNHSLMVLTDVPSTIASDVSALFNMSVIPVGELETRLVSYLTQETVGAIPKVTDTVTDSTA